MPRTAGDRCQPIYPNNRENEQSHGHDRMGAAPPDPSLEEPAAHIPAGPGLTGRLEAIPNSNSRSGRTAARLFAEDLLAHVS